MQALRQILLSSFPNVKSANSVDEFCTRVSHLILYTNLKSRLCHVKFTVRVLNVQTRTTHFGIISSSLNFFIKLARNFLPQRIYFNLHWISSPYYRWYMYGTFTSFIIIYLCVCIVFNMRDLDNDLWFIRMYCCWYRLPSVIEKVKSWAIEKCSFSLLKTDLTISIPLLRHYRIGMVPRRLVSIIPNKFSLLAQSWQCHWDLKKHCHWP